MKYHLVIYPPTVGSHLIVEVHGTACVDQVFGGALLLVPSPTANQHTPRISTSIHIADLDIQCHVINWIPWLL